MKDYLRLAAARARCENCQQRTGPYVSDGVLGSVKKGCYGRKGEALARDYQGDLHFRFKCKMACCTGTFAVRRDVRPEEDNDKKSKHRTFIQRFGHQWTEHVRSPLTPVPKNRR